MSDDLSLWAKTVIEAVETIDRMSYQKRHGTVKINYPREIQQDLLGKLHDELPQSLRYALRCYQVSVETDLITCTLVVASADEDRHCIATPEKDRVLDVIEIQREYLQHLSNHSVLDTKIELTETTDKLTLSIEYDDLTKSSTDVFKDTRTLQSAATKINISDNTMTYTFDMTFANSEGWFEDGDHAAPNVQDELWRLFFEVLETIRFQCPFCDSHTMFYTDRENILLSCTDCNGYIYCDHTPRDISAELADIGIGDHTTTISEFQTQLPQSFIDRDSLGATVVPPTTPNTTPSETTSSVLDTEFTGIYSGTQYGLQLSNVFDLKLRKDTEDLGNYVICDCDSYALKIDLDMESPVRNQPQVCKLCTQYTDEYVIEDVFFYGLPTDSTEDPIATQINQRICVDCQDDLHTAYQNLLDEYNEYVLANQI